MTYQTGNAPTSWGIEKAADPAYPAWTTFLDQVSAAGYQGTELGPYGYLPTDATVLSQELERRCLKLTAAYVMDVFHDSTRRTEVLKHAQRVCALMQELGAAHLVLIAGIASQRADTAGRSEVAPRLGANDFETFCYTIRALADIASAHGLAAGLHPHAGTHLEFEDEIDRLMNAVSDDPVGLVVDTGHSAYAGIDPRALIRQYGDRVIYVHLKDVNPRIREQALQQGLGFWQAYSAGIFCVLGQGLNDFPGIRDSLQAIGYSGWLTVEQDADPQGLSDPLVDARQSLSFLQSIGLAS